MPNASATIAFTPPSGSRWPGPSKLDTMLASLPLDRSPLHPGDRLAVALSGGADSVALLLALHQQRESLGIGLSAAHVHHGIRGEAADADQHFVAALCTRLDIPLHLHRADVPARAATQHETLEEAARATRYAFFHQLILDGQATSVLTAHTRNDQAETVLMKLLRGAWTDGLAGIYPVLEVRSPTAPATARPAGHILRPLLATSRADILAFLQAANQPWQQDETNADPAFTRNRLRHEILPTLRTLNPSLDETLANLAEIAREEEAHWQVELARLLPHLLLPGKPVRGGGRAVSTAAERPSSLAIEIERLRPFDTATRRRVLRAAARTLGPRLRFDETARLEALCGLRTHPTVSSRPGAVLELAHGLRAERSARELRLSVPATPPAESLAH